MGKSNLRPDLTPSRPQLFDRVIRVCQKDIGELSVEHLLASGLTDDPDNPLASKLQRAIAWTNSIKELCETYQDKVPKECQLFLQDAARLRAQIHSEFNTMQWVEASAAILKNHPTDEKLASTLEWRRHQIVNNFTAYLHLDVLVAHIEKEKASNQSTPSHGNRLQQERSSFSDDLPSH